ncbi:hypothetical protein [Microbispora hainanensis]|uniref:Gfo/Idh/MocA-like oxidoreductase C-terminal domain-containing protein n=1 Tax=Microbispora hainanensis TaxID=568844 RepID=A0ABZ1T0K4_9ACTN|nr:hypothetical protein [Microbispora hainanensis]
MSFPGRHLADRPWWFFGSGGAREAGSLRLDGGTMASVAVYGGAVCGGAVHRGAVHGGDGSPDGFFVKLAGSVGTLTITPPRPGVHMHWTDWDIRSGDDRVAVPDAYRTVPFDPAAGPAASVAAFYQEIARAIAEGRPAHPDFHAAARHHRLLAAIERAAESGGIERVP